MLDMASTTLVTFLFDCPAAARSVELVGSWDNFQNSYYLKQDRRRGRDIWSVTPIFDDIICDGDLDHTLQKRTGALMMGGTYWYYYKVDDEEHHNPSEPSTTHCPLLPGQRLNVLEVPMEGRSRSNSETSAVFTRNPQDKFLTPVPPKTLPSPRLGDLVQETYSVSKHSYRGPRSATYPGPDRSLTPSFPRHARSASTSPQLGSGPSFSDLRGIKEKLASKRSTSGSRGKNVRELQIGAPTLISTTAEDVNLIPLASLRTPSTASSVQPPPTSTSSAPPLTARMGFSPLGSNPVRISQDLDFSSLQKEQNGRPRSQEPPVVSREQFKISPTHDRAKSADVRKTRHNVFSNEPWVSSPKFRQSFDSETNEAEQAQPAPVLERPSNMLQPPSPQERPSSSHGGDGGSSLRKYPLDKELPPLPRYLTPAPLFACHTPSPSPALPEEPQQPAEETQDAGEEVDEIPTINPHFSTWSSESETLSSVTSDEDSIHSLSFSSLTSNGSGPSSPQRLSHFSQDSSNRASTIDLTDDADDSESLSSVSASPPQLDDLRISTFGPSLMNLEIRHSRSSSRRQVSCFGPGFQGYSLPEETGSQATITKSTLQAEPTIQPERDSTVSQLEKLMSEFGYLGDSVL
ncbi:hypothetical protein BS50DRAFT_31781 [Corynespora cassiicola Philippines]|uniref:Uncharacterized protein n=1 Tax=Corynespora cassiicola Philippines TaxID=1448308 RepID=A0A2T2PBL3_CORCC|nr:hypothetical protein BS50DRAFT_31781 [Corynespora cassiicola Philippines]